MLQPGKCASRRVRVPHSLGDCTPQVGKGLLAPQSESWLYTTLCQSIYISHNDAILGLLHHGNSSSLLPFSLFDNWLGLIGPVLR